MGSGAVFLDSEGRVLIVKPSYKPDWLIPGGVVEGNESPYVCCVREVEEELGIAARVGQLLVVDYQPQSITKPEKTESLQFVFWGGVLSDDEIRRIRLPDNGELENFKFAEIPEALALLNPGLALRVAKSLEAQAKDSSYYLEHGMPIPTF
jgi:8-oxo-dGTP pyrophosphatase MutT (NUDIX family)